VKSGAYNNRISAFTKMMFEILDSEPINIRVLVSEKPSRFNVAGVYLINSPADDNIVYVGRTKTNTITKRIQDHRSINTDSDLKGKLKMYSDYPQKINEYLIRCLAVSDCIPSEQFGQIYSLNKETVLS